MRFICIWSTAAINWEGSNPKEIAEVARVTAVMCWWR